MKFTIDSRSLAETVQWGRKLAGILTGGDVVCLYGQLGAGKTSFTQGVGRGLELDESVVSPTFTLIHAYDLPFVRRRAARFIHMDLYRLGTVEEAEQIGVDDCQQEDAIVLIEWPESALPLLDADRLELTIEGCGDQPRRLTFQSAAEAWRQRLAEGDIP